MLDGIVVQADSNVGVKDELVGAGDRTSRASDA
jgi:hypothetical protein